MAKNVCKVKKDVVCGMILGAIAGDCLGTPCIFMKSDSLYELASNLCWEISESGFCTRMISCGLKSANRYGMNLDALVHAYHRLATSDLEMDCITALCFGRGARNADTMKRLAATLSHGALCSNQLLIRQIPIVLAGLSWDRDTLLENVRSECLLTHTDAASIEYAQLYAICLQGILQGKSRLEIWDLLQETVQTAAVRGILTESYYSRPVCDKSDYSHARTAFQLAMYHYWHHTPFVSALRSAVLSGGATDVNAAATGALCGASDGIATIPRAWLETMADCRFDTGIHVRRALRLSTLLAHSNLIQTHHVRHPLTTARRPNTASRFDRAGNHAVRPVND